MNKFKSRKLWVMITANIFAMLIFFMPEQQDKISEWNELVAAGISTLTNLGYLIAQGGVDKAEASK